MSKGYMTQHAVPRWIVLGSMAIAMLLSQPLLAGTPEPTIPHPKNAKQCVEDTEVMRKQHFEFLLHQRDETMHKGIRTKKHSLKNCISCHVVEENGQPVSVQSPKHFCRVCHDYASVNIDCFECHASKPRPKKAAMPHAQAPETESSGQAMAENAQPDNVGSHSVNEMSKGGQL